MLVLDSGALSQERLPILFMEIESRGGRSLVSFHGRDFSHSRRLVSDAAAGGWWVVSQPNPQ